MSVRRWSSWALLAVSLGLSACGGSTQVAHATPFAATSVWNAELPANAPLDRRSRQLVREFSRQLATTAPWVATNKFSTPIYTVSAIVPKLPVVVNGHS